MADSFNCTLDGTWPPHPPHFEVIVSNYGGDAEFPGLSDCTLDGTWPPHSPHFEVIVSNYGGDAEFPGLSVRLGWLLMLLV